MNERIQELLEQSKEYIEQPLPNDIYNMGDNVFRRYEVINQQKFAELIVRECGNIAFEHWALTHDTSPQAAILKHFGVEA